jgi:hypothetical protein
VRRDEKDFLNYGDLFHVKLHSEKGIKVSPSTSEKIPLIKLPPISGIAGALPHRVDRHCLSRDARPASNREPGPERLRTGGGGQERSAADSPGIRIRFPRTPPARRALQGDAHSARSAATSRPRRLRIPAPAASVDVRQLPAAKHDVPARVAAARTHRSHVHAARR